MAEDVMRRNTPYVLPGSSLSDALAKFASTHLPELPVLHSLSDRRLLGTLAYPDVLNAYQDEIFKADAPQALSRGLASLAGQPLEIAPGYELSEWDPPANLHGKSLAAARLPDTRGARVLLIKRLAPDGLVQTFLPDARTIIQAADTLILLGPTPTPSRTNDR